MIVLDKDREKYSFTKRYETFGNYTRYIPVGSQMIENQTLSLPDDLLVSSFCFGKQYTIVAVNPTDQTIHCSLYVKGAKQTGDLMQYTTNESQKWEETKVKSKGRNYRVSIPPYSVTSFVGAIE